MVKHQVAYTNQGLKITINQNEKYLRDLSANKNIYLDKNIKIPLIVAGGEKQTLHFKMINESITENGISYSYNEGMSLIHVSIQEQIKQHLEQKYNIFCTLEKRLPQISRIADIYFECDSSKYVVEVQKSKQDRLKYIERTKDYEKLGIKCVWLVVPNNIEKRYKDGFNNARDINNFELIISEDKPFLSDIVKINEGTRLVCDIDNCCKDEFINYLFNPVFGSPVLEKIYENDYKLKHIKQEISNFKHILQNTIRKNKDLDYRNDILINTHEKLFKRDLEIKEIIESNTIIIKKLENSQKEILKKEYIKNLKNDTEVKDILLHIKNRENVLKKYSHSVDKIKEQYEIWYKELDLIKKGVDIGYPGSTTHKEVRDYIYSIGEYKK